jgi:predicted RNase H-like nuclease (RuvC/YqgF family)
VEVGMDSQAFDILEQKLHKILTKLEVLKGENEKLKLKNQELKSLVEEKENRLQSFQTESEEVTHMRTNLEAYQSNEKMIRTKVESLLQRLNDFDDIE